MSQNSYTPTPLRPLTPKEKRVLEFIESYLQTMGGVAPSYKEIKDHFGFASFNSVQRYLKQLQNKGYIHVPGGNQKRAITVLHSSQSVSKALSHSSHGGTGLTQRPFVSNQHLTPAKTPPAPSTPAESLHLPLLGRVAAGQPIEALEHDEFIETPSTWVRSPEHTFALRVEGQSMIEDGIFDGDVIFVQKQQQARNGETIVATVDNEATVKRFYTHQVTSALINKNPQLTAHSTGSYVVELRPANKDMQSFWYSPEEVEIQGVVVGLIRTF